MASTALMLVVLWQRTPWLFAALAGPLVAISLYQRTTHKALSAMRLALTDPLTGLGNHRHFQERLQRELAKAEAETGLVSLCLLDVDSFKQINDRHGHQAGDRILTQVAARLRQGGEAFRLGGDEFAVLLPGLDAAPATEVASAIVERIREADVRPVGEISVSAGVAGFPQHSRERDSLIRLADRALYRAKERGQEPRRTSPRTARSISRSRARRPRRPTAARFGSVSTLARAVDARDAYAGSHSERVSALAVRIGEQLALTHDELELARLAGRLHDLGKLAVPREILCKEGPLSAAERRGDRAAHGDRVADGREHRARRCRTLGAPPPRALGRHRLSGQAARRGDPARRTDHLRRRRVRLDDLGRRLPAGHEPRRGARTRCGRLREHSSTRPWSRRWPPTWPLARRRTRPRRRHLRYDE